MNARVGHLIDEALALAPDERSAVVMALLDSLDGEDEASVSSAWAEEIRRRRADLRTGVVKAVPWSEARARLSALWPFTFWRSLRSRRAPRQRQTT